MKRISTRATLFALLFISTVTSTAAIKYVNLNATGDNIGTSWTDAFTTVSAAIAAASSGDEIWVAAGTYYPTSGSDRTISFTIPSGVKLYGGFAGTETLLTERNWNTNICILSGDIGTAGVNTDNSYHVIKFSGAINTTRIDGFTITHGYANGASPDNCGGGISNKGTVAGSSPIVENCKILDNYADRDGGGIFSDGNGSGNTATISILKSVISGNTAATHNGGGIEIYAWTGTSNATIENSLITGNKSFSFGGGIEFAAGYVGSFVTGTMTFCTVSGNYSGSSGKGIYTQVQTGVMSLNIKNCIAYGNGSLNGSAYEVQNNASGKTSILYSQVEGCTSGSWYTVTNNTDGGNNADANPLFVNGVSAASAPSTAGDYTVQSGSPCISTGTDVPGISTDINGILRPSPPSRGSAEYSVVLPVTWLVFDARCDKGKIQLTWSTAAENNNSRFIAERSAEPGKWTTAGELPASGQETAIHTYSITDNFTGNAQYRIRQVDFNGRMSFSPVVFAGCALQDNNFSVFPNPASDVIIINGVKAGSVYRIINYSGQVLHSGVIGSDRQIIPVRHLPAGLCQLQVTDQHGFTRTEKILINKR